MSGRAVFIGHQEIPEDLPIALFNVDLPGNELDGSTVDVKTIVRLGLRDLVDRAGRKLLTVPLPKKTEVVL